MTDAKENRKMTIGKMPQMQKSPAKVEWRALLLLETRVSKQPPYATTNIVVTENIHCTSDVSIRKLYASRRSPQRSTAMYCLLTVGSRCGWTRPHRARRVEVHGCKALCLGVLLCFPAFFAQHAEPSITDFVPQRF